MKQISIFILFLLLLPACLFSQNKKGTTELKTFNLTTLSGEIPYYVSDYLRDNTPEELKRHPEYGRLPYDAPCQNCVEVIEKRSAESRFFVDKDDPSHFYTQQSKGAMHYQDAQGFWRYSDPRLIQRGNGVYEAYNQYQPKKLDLKQQYIAIYHAGKELKFNRNLKLWHQDSKGQKTLVASANWADYTVGDEGIRVKNIFPGVDMEAGFDARAIKTDFVIRQKPTQTEGNWLIEDELDVPNGFYFAKNPSNKIQQDNDGSYKGNIWLMNEKGENHFTLGQIIAYDARPATRGKGISLAYLLDEQAKKYQMRIPLNWLQDSKTVYPVTIDPIVTGPQAIYNTGNIPFVDPGSGTWSAYCSNFLTVSRPNNSAITNIYFDMQYVALDWLSNGGGCGLFDCWLSDAAFTIHSTCGQSPPLNLFWTVASPGGDGPGTGTNTNTPAPDLVSCLPPACTGTATFELRTYSYFSCSAGCVTDCHYVPNGAWRMTMEGETLGANPVVVTGGGTTICQGQSATLTANHQGGVPTFSYLWNPGGANTPTITVSPASTTNYTVQITDNCGTIVNANQTITVNTPANAEFIYSAAAYCSNDPNPLPIHNAGGVDGTYTATPAGLSLNPSTGLINLAASTPGTYTVTNSVTAGAPCPSATANFVVTIVPGANAEFQYNNTSYCQGGAAPVLSHIAGGTDGVYTAAPAGLSLNGVTGAINLAASTPGTYTVTNTVTNTSGGATCTDVETFTLTITASPDASFAYNGSSFCLSGADPILSVTGIAGTFTSVPALGGLASNGTISLAASAAGNYTITNTVTVAGCTSTASVPLTLVTSPVADFAYDLPTYCQTSASAPVITFLNGGIAGTFSAVPAGLSLNTVTGDIDPATSALGTYTVTNFVNLGGCQATATTTVTIIASPDPSFNYNGSSFCLSGADPILTVIGVAGTFTSTPALGGLASNGNISLAASAAGNYTITNTVTVGGCTASASVPLNLVTSPVADFAYDLPSYCQNAAAPILSYLNGGIAGTFTAAPAGLSINATTGAVNLAASAAGSYTVTNTVNLGGCQDVVSTTIDVLATPDASFSYNAASFCQSGANPVLTVTGVAGNFTSVPALGGLSSNGSISLAASAPGSYTITNTVTVAGCTGTFSTPITINLAPVADFNYSSATFCQNSANPLPNFVNGGAAGTFTSNPVGLSLNSATGLINLAASTAGTYTVTNTQTSAGCPNDVETFSVTLVAVPNAEFSYTAASFCQTTGSTATPQHLAGGVNGTYTATPAGLIINAATGVIDLAVSAAGTYTVTNTVSGAGVCPNDVETTTITLVAPGNAQFTYGSNVFCISGGTNPTASYPTGGTAGTFSATPAGLSINTLTGTINLAASAVGTYTVTNTLPASGPCAAVSATQSVTIGNTANAEFSYTSATFCQTGTNPLPQHLAGGIDGTYTATAGLIINAATGEINLAASTPGTYVVTNTIAAAGGCAATSFTQSVTITPAPDANFSYGAATFCQSGTNPVPGHPNGGTDGTYTGAPGGISVNPATGEINLAASVPGVYTITNTVAGNAGCAAATFTQSVTITPPLNAEFAYTSNTYCNSGTAVPQFLTGGVAGTFTYTVVSGGPTLALNPVTGEIDLALSSPGVYQVTNALGANAGCAGTSFMQVIVISPAPSADFAYNASSYCITGNNPVVILAPGALNGAFTYTSSTGGTLALDPNNGSIVLSGSTPGTYTITNSIPAANGCSGSTFSQTITISAGGDAEFAYDKVAYCKVGANPILSHTTGTDGTYSYVVVSGGPNLSLDPATGAINLAASDLGVYQVTNTLAATSGCASDIKSVNIAIEGAPDAEFYYDRSIYCGNQIPFISHLSGVNGTYSYQVLSGGPSILLNPTNGSIDLTFSNPGTYQITNIVQGGACPADTHSVIITYAGKPVATINPTGFFDLCTVGSITLQTSGGAAYQWLNYGQATGNINNSYTVSAAGNYSAVVYNSAGCSDTSDVVVIQSVNLPSADLVTSPQTICPGESATLLGIGQGNLQWSYNGVPIQGANASSLVVNQAGIYTLSASNFCGTDSAVTSVNLSAGPQADFLWEPTTIYAGQLFNFIDQSLSGYTWSWNFGNGGTSNLQNPTNIYANPGVYPVSVYVTDAFGCKDTVNKLVTVTVISIDSVFVPNTFTPNGDGVHDEFGVDAKGFKDYQIEIFDRWGVRVFETTASNKKWGGLNLNGVPCASGVYFYVLKLTDDAGKEYVKKSNLHLIR